LHSSQPILLLDFSVPRHITSFPTRRSSDLVVGQIFEWVGGERAGLWEVCRRLQVAGEQTRSGNSRWDRSTVWGILKNPAYKGARSEEHTSELQSREDLVCRLLLANKDKRGA